MLKLFLVLVSLQTPTVEDLFESGDKAINRGDWEKVSHDFNDILDEYGPYRLNEMGKVICYWNIHIAEKNMGHDDKSSQALLGFISYGSDIVFHGGVVDKMWASEFRLIEKLHHGYALLQARWARTNAHSCRLKRFACHINEVDLIDVFKREMPFCRGEKVIGTITREADGLTEVDVLCESHPENYYFKVAE